MNGSSVTETDVIIIGGGATGAGVARDCARRGLKAVLLERHDIATGATGRNHGLLHSGARYAVTDSESARECIEENKILKRIAHHCIEKTDGLLLPCQKIVLNTNSNLLLHVNQLALMLKRLIPRKLFV